MIWKSIVLVTSALIQAAMKKVIAINNCWIFCVFNREYLDRHISSFDKYDWPLFLSLVYFNTNRLSKLPIRQELILLDRNCIFNVLQAVIRIAVQKLFPANVFQALNTFGTMKVTMHSAIVLLRAVWTIEVLVNSVWMNIKISQ